MTSDDESTTPIVNTNNTNASFAGSNATASGRVPKEPTGNVIEDTFMGTMLNLSGNNKRRTPRKPDFLGGSPINHNVSGASVTSSIASRTVNATNIREKELTKLSMEDFAGIIAVAFV